MFRYSYDAFGTIIEGDLSGGQNYGYLGKQFDSQTELYNYGYRDYTPKVARFTTVDPVRDGKNWFCYVNNDPVNFVDLWGLSSSDAVSVSETRENINWVKEITDCIDEIKFGIEIKAAVKIPNVITIEGSLDLVSVDFINNKGDDSNSGYTSGIKASVSIGNEDAPVVQGSVEYSKKVPLQGTAMDLLQTDYELSTEFEINNDGKVSVPIPFTGLSVTVNTSEILDLGQKAVDSTMKFFGGNK